MTSVFNLDVRLLAEADVAEIVGEARRENPKPSAMIFLVSNFK